MSVSQSVPSFSTCVTDVTDVVTKKEGVLSVLVNDQREHPSSSLPLKHIIWRRVITHLSGLSKDGGKLTLEH